MKKLSNCPQKNTIILQKYFQEFSRVPKHFGQHEKQIPKFSQAAQNVMYLKKPLNVNGLK